MHRLVFLLTVPLLLVFSIPTHASNLDYQTKINDIQEQREEIKRKLDKAEGYDIVKLSREDMELTAHQEAYEKALEILKGQSEISLEPTFTPITLKPGQVVPIEYVPYYQAAGERFGIDWFVLAAIHEIETSYSTHPSMLSTAGAVGHMQFLPSTFNAYAIDGNGDGQRSPWNVQDAIFTAANYLASSGYKKDVRKAIWHYNHAEWYVNKVLATSERIKGQ